MSNKKEEKNYFTGFTKPKVDLDSKEEKPKEEREKPGQVRTGRDKFPPLPNGFSSNRPH